MAVFAAFVRDRNAVIAAEGAEIFF